MATCWLSAALSITSTVIGRVLIGSAVRAAVTTIPSSSPWSGLNSCAATGAAVSTSGKTSIE